MLKKISLIVLSIVTLSGWQSAWAHHSYVMFDRDQRLHLSGTVKIFDWRNPHVFIIIDVADKDTSEVTEWKIETGGSNFLRRMGWSRTSLKPGDQVDMLVNPRIDGEPGGGLVEASVGGTKIGK